MTTSILRLLLSSLLGSFFYLILGWLIFDVVLGAYTEAHTTALEGFKKTTDFSMPFLYASCLAYSILINFILFHTNINSLVKAISFSAIVGVLVASMTDFFWYASSTFYSNFTVVCLDLAGAAVSVGALGGLSFMMLRKKGIFN
jgi:hypothetical protein